MKTEHRVALGIGAVGLAAMAWGLFAEESAPAIALIVAAGAAPAAMLAMVWGRIGGGFPYRAVLLGGLVGPVVAILTQPLVAAFAVAFLLGFADSGRQLVEALRVDPRLITALSSPWVLLALIELATVAPLTEEFGKAVGSVLARPTSRRQAFLFGVAAGTGFAIVEDLLYASVGSIAGGPSVAIAVARSMGAAVHPLATGLVTLGWWEWRHSRRTMDLVKGYLSGVGVHALWNGSLVVIAVVKTALQVGAALGPLAPVALSYSAARRPARRRALDGQHFRRRGS